MAIIINGDGNCRGIFLSVASGGDGLCAGGCYVDFAGAGGFGYFCAAGFADGYGKSFSPNNRAVYTIVCAGYAAFSGACAGAGLCGVVVLFAAVFCHSFYLFRRVGNVVFSAGIGSWQMADRLMTRADLAAGENCATIGVVCLLST